LTGNTPNFTKAWASSRYPSLAYIVCHGNPTQTDLQYGAAIAQPHLSVAPKQVQLTKFSFRDQEVERGIFKFCIPSPPQNNKYYTPLLPHCTTKLLPSISKKYHSAQLDLRWWSDLAVTGGGGGVSQQMVGIRYQRSACVCYAGQAEQLSEDTAQAPTLDAPSIHRHLNLGSSQVRISFPFLSPLVVISLA
jgi:hypothetical protein